MSFDLYAQQDVTREPIPVTLTDLRHRMAPHPTHGHVHPVAFLVPADGDNRGWMDDLLLDAKAGPEELGVQGQYDPRAEAEAERRLRIRLAKHCVKRIENVQDDDRVVDTDEPAKILEFMLKIPKFVVMKIKRYVENAVNFQRKLEDIPTLPPASTVDALAKKSPPV